MDLQEAIIQVVEEWREKRGMTKIQVGMAIFPASPEPRVAGDKWNHIVKGRNTTNKKRQHTIDELDKLADFFGVHPETLIIEARQRMGKISGKGSPESVKTG